MENLIYKYSFNSKKSRSQSWYIITISIVLALVIWGIFTAQYGMSFVIILISGIMFFVENNSADLVEVSFNNLGLKVGESFYEYATIKQYAFIYNGENPIFLRLFLNKKGLSLIDINISKSEINDVKNILEQYLGESNSTELGFLEKIILLFKI